jgi:outer membrane murein-binding lipoprotein Lpp
MTERKPLNRFAIGAGVLCVILLGGLVYAVAQIGDVTSSKNAELKKLNSQMSSINFTKNTEISRLSGLVSSINSSKTAEIDKLNSQVADLNSKVTNLTRIVNLEETTVWVDHKILNQMQNQSHDWTFVSDHAGYVIIDVQSSTTDKTYVQLSYVANAVYYDSGRIFVGSFGWKAFPVVPGYINFRVGNTNLNEGATEMVTVTLHY